jgi:hypothetical protein
MSSERFPGLISSPVSQVYSLHHSQIYSDQSMSYPPIQSIGRSNTILLRPIRSLFRSAALGHHQVLRRFRDRCRDFVGARTWLVIEVVLGPRISSESPERAWDFPPHFVLAGTRMRLGPTNALVGTHALADFEGWGGFFGRGDLGVVCAWALCRCLPVFQRIQRFLPPSVLPMCTQAWAVSP